MSTFSFELNKTIAQGDDRIIKLVFDTTVQDWEFYYTAKKKHTDTDAEAAITVNPSEVLYSESVTDYTNTVEIPLSSLATNIEPGNYIHDIKVLKPGGVVNTIATGKLVINPHVTKRKTE